MVAEHLNIGLTAAEAAGSDVAVRDDGGWNWGTTTAVGLFILIPVGNFAASKVSPGLVDKIPLWVGFAYIFGLVPAFGISGMVLARIRGGRYRRALERARKLASTHPGKLLYCGNMGAEDAELAAGLVGRIERAREVLMTQHRPSDARAAGNLMLAALSVLGSFLAHAVPASLPATLGMLDSEVERLADEHHKALDSLQNSYAMALSAIQELEAAAGIGAEASRSAAAR